MTAGGPRKNAGRKPVDKDDKIVPLTFYVKAKNKAALKTKFEPLIKKADK